MQAVVEELKAKLEEKEAQQKREEHGMLISNGQVSGADGLEGGLRRWLTVMEEVGVEILRAFF